MIARRRVFGGFCSVVVADRVGKLLILSRRRVLWLREIGGA